MTPDERLAAIAKIIEIVDHRCQAADGPVTPTVDEIDAKELRQIYHLAKGGFPWDESEPNECGCQLCTELHKPETEPCPSCNGQGLKAEKKGDVFVFASPEYCPDCKGTGLRVVPK